MIKKYITSIDTDFYKKTILEKEKKIIETYPSSSSGGTGLSENSLTSRFKFYNLLEWQESETLRREIKKFYNVYTNNQEELIYVQCWANVLRNGEKINLHSHISEGQYKIYGGISGNFFVYSDIETYTIYHFGEENNTFILNRPGIMTLFPSIVFHKVDKYTGNNERISIAFDIKTEKDWKVNVLDQYKSHWIRL